MKKILSVRDYSLSTITNIIQRSIRSGYLPDDWNKQRKLIGCNIIVVDNNYNTFFSLESDVVEIGEYWYSIKCPKVYFDTVNNVYALERDSCYAYLPSGRLVLTDVKGTAYFTNDEIDKTIIIDQMYEYPFISSDHIVYRLNRSRPIIVHKDEIIITFEGEEAYKWDCYYWEVDLKYHLDEYYLRYSDSFNEFINKFEDECEICRLLKEAKRDHSLLKFKSPNYVTFREREGMISYQPYGKDCKWQREGRQGIKPGKFIRIFLKKEFSDKDLEMFANRFKKYEQGDELKFKFVTFEEGYCTDNWYGFGDGIKSCMWNQEWTEFYPPAAKMLVAYSENKGFLGRAIVWDAKKHDNDESITVMDRIYAKDDVMHAMRDYAKSQNWYRRYRNSYEDKEDFFDMEGSNKIQMKLYIELPHNCPDDRAPYLDTFTYGVYKKLFNFVPEMPHLIYNDTDGEVHTSQRYGQIQVDSGAWCDEEDVVYLDSGTYAPDEVVECCITGETVPKEGTAYFLLDGRTRRFYVSDRKFIIWNEDAEMYHIMDENLEEVLYTSFNVFLI